jgi:hypothetical protein
MSPRRPRHIQDTLTDLDGLIAAHPELRAPEGQGTAYDLVEGAGDARDEADEADFHPDAG